MAVICFISIINFYYFNLLFLHEVCMTRQIFWGPIPCLHYVYCIICLCGDWCHYVLHMRCTVTC